MQGVALHWRHEAPRRHGMVVPVDAGHAGSVGGGQTPTSVVGHNGPGADFARRARDPARPRADRGQTSSAAVAGREPTAGLRRPAARHWSPRHAPSTTGPVSSTRCTPTSSAPATRPCRSSTRSTGCATAAASSGRVVAIQHGRAIFNLQASFHIDRAGAGSPHLHAERPAGPGLAPRLAHADGAVPGAARRVVRAAAIPSICAMWDG